MTEAARTIEDFFRRRYGREALYLPSGRVALYLAFREWLRPGDRLLMSPVTDDVVFFTVLAAGLVPVLAPVEPCTGNIDLDRIDHATWRRLRGVLTTNLYGIPDRMDLLEERCRHHGLVLLEDACHALDSHFGARRIGQFGVAAAYSLSKHVAGVGGVLTFSEAGRRQSLVRQAQKEIRRWSPFLAVGSWARPLLRTTLARTKTLPWARGIRDRLTRRRPARSGHRIVYDTGQVLQARAEGAGLDRFDPWVRVDKPGYRTWPPDSAVRATLRRLESFEENRRLRLAGAPKLLALDLTPPDLSIPPDTALFRVPLFVRERGKVLVHFAERGLPLDYIYDPPLDLYARELAEPLPSPSAARIWSRDVLPVDPLLADSFVALLDESPGLCQPALETVAIG